MSIAFTPQQSRVLGRGLLGQVERAKSNNIQRAYTMLTYHGATTPESDLIRTANAMLATAGIQLEVVDQRYAIERLNEIDDLKKENERLRHMLTEANKRAQHAEIKIQDIINEANEIIAEANNAGTRMITVSEASDATGLHRSTIIRYLNEGFWQGTQDKSRRWLIATNQPLSRKSS